MKILLLEDDYNLAEVIKEILSLENYIIDIANNADEAYELTYNNNYDLYIFDINLPDENGLDVLKNLKDANDNTPAIYISALSDISTIAKAFEIGANDYLKKPFDVEELLIRIKAKFPTEDIIKIKNFTYNLTTKELKQNNKFISLGSILKEIFHKLVLNKNKLTPKNILLEIVDFNDSSLRVHINKLKKMGFEIKNIRGEGYIFEV